MGLKDIDSILKDEELENVEEYSNGSSVHLEFSCPNCGKIESDDVIFLCNRCDAKQMINISDINMCPSCLEKGENFMCLRCDSKQVKLKNSIDSLI